MAFFIVPIEAMNFDRKQVTEIVGRTRGCTALHPVDDGFVDLEWTFALEDQEVACSLQAGGEAIDLEPETVAAAAFAHRFAREAGIRMDLIDDQYTFQLSIGNYESAEELWTAIQNANASSTDGPEPFRG